MSGNDQQHFDEIQKYSHYVCEKPEVFDYVLSEHRRIQNRDSVATTYFLFVSPRPRQGEMGIVEVVWALAPDFQDLVKPFIRSGCIPLGIVDFASSWCEAFISLAPEAFRDTLQTFAAIIFAKVLREYKTQTDAGDLPHHGI
jgi:hypothetical protein